MHLFARDWFGVALGAEHSWNPATPEDPGFEHRYGLGLEGAPGGALGRFLEIGNELAALFPTWEMDNHFRYERLIPRPGETLALNTEGWHEVLAVVDRARPVLAQVAGAEGDDAEFWRWTVDELSFHARLRFALVRWGPTPPAIPEIDTFIAEQEGLRDRLARLCFLENRDHATAEALAPDTSRLAALREFREQLAGSTGLPPSGAPGRRAVFHLLAVGRAVSTLTGDAVGEGARPARFHGRRSSGRSLARHTLRCRGDDPALGKASL